MNTELVCRSSSGLSEMSTGTQPVCQYEVGVSDKVTLLPFRQSHIHSLYNLLIVYYFISSCLHFCPAGLFQTLQRAHARTHARRTRKFVKQIFINSPRYELKTQPETKITMGSNEELM